MKKLSIFAIFCAGTFLASCSMNSLEEEMPRSGRVVDFTASVGGYAVKSTDTGFEEGDAVGISALAPIHASNVQFTYKSGKLAATSPILWGETQEASAKTTFLARYPYDGKADPAQAFEFTVNADQSSKPLYSASDLMTAKAEAAPADKTVPLSFNHLLSKVVITIDNQLQDEIAEVYLDNVYGKATVNIAENSLKAVENSVGMIKASPVTVNGAAAWALIVVPQDISPKLIVTTASKKQYSYTIPGKVSFVSGKQSNAKVIIDENAISTRITTEVVDWESDNTLNFTNEPEYEEPWYIEGYVGGFRSEYGVSILMEYAGNGAYAKTINYEAGQNFWLRRYGLTLWLPQPEDGETAAAKADGKPFALETDGVAITLEESGIYTLTFDASNFQLTIEKVTEEWTSIGKGFLIDNAVDRQFNKARSVREVEFEECAQTPGRYRLVNPYADYKEYEGFSVSDESCIYINAQSPDQVFIERHSLGITYEEQEWFIEQWSPEGSMENGEISLSWIALSHNDGWGGWYDILTVLPGYERQTYYVGLDGFYAYVWNNDEGHSMISFEFRPQIDNAWVRLAVFTGEWDDDFLETMKKGEDKNILTIEANKLTPGLYQTIQTEMSKYDIPGAYRYTAVVYTEGPDNQSDFAFWTFIHVPEGDEPPPCEITLGDVKPSETFPESELTVTVSGKEIDYIRIAAATQQALEEGEWTDRYGEYARTHGQYYGIVTEDGTAVTVSAPDPETDYVIIVYAENIYGATAVRSSKGTTGKAPEWKDLGKGTYTDNTEYFGGYHAEVDIQQAGDLLRYRVLNPYGPYWENASDEFKENHYTGSTSGSFEFYLKESAEDYFVFFTNFKTGLRLNDGEDSGEAEYGHEGLYLFYRSDIDLHNYYASRNNIQLSEGVFQLAPAVYRVTAEETWWYSEYYVWEYYRDHSDQAVLITLPGYEYDGAAYSRRPHVSALPDTSAEPKALRIQARNKVEKYRPRPIALSKQVHISVSDAPVNSEAPQRPDRKK